MPVDILAFGPHPDDIEIGIGASIALHAASGHSVGLCDLTEGELSSNGAPSTRLEEARAAASVLGAAWRENLGWPDGGIEPSPDQIRSAVTFIRRHTPRTLVIPYWKDRHPDHEAASRTLRIAAFRSGLRRFETGQAPWRLDWICYYFINDGAKPSFVVDVSRFYDRKWLALACYGSQFAPRDAGAVPTRLTAESFRHLIESRDAQFGALTGTRFAEGLVVREPVQRASLLKSG